MNRRVSTKRADTKVSRSFQPLFSWRSIRVTRSKIAEFLSRNLQRLNDVHRVLFRLHFFSDLVEPLNRTYSFDSLPGYRDRFRINVDSQMRQFVLQAIEVLEQPALTFRPGQWWHLSPVLHRYRHTC